MDNMQFSEQDFERWYIDYAVSMDMETLCPNMIAGALDVIHSLFESGVISSKLEFLYGVILNDWPQFAPQEQIVESALDNNWGVSGYDIPEDLKHKIVPLREVG